MQGEDSGLVSCDVVLLGGRCSAFWRNVVSPSSLVSIPRGLALGGEGTIVFQTSGTTHQRTQCHIPEDLNVQQHHSENLISCSFKGIWETDAVGSVWVLEEGTVAGWSSITLFVVFTKYSFYPNEVAPYVSQCPFVVCSCQENLYTEHV
jgi:hypothetical protein